MSAFKKIALSFLGICIGLVLSEVILKVLDIPKFYKERIDQAYPCSVSRFHMFRPDSVVIWTNCLSSKGRFIYDGNPRNYFDADNSVYYKTNSQSFRGDEFIQEKDSGTFRIAFLGDSFTFGEGVKDQDTYAETLKAILQKKYGSLNFDCYNFGVGGYNTEEELSLLKYIVLSYRPNAVVLGYNLNDVQPKAFRYDKIHDTIIYRDPLKIHESLPDGKPSKKFIFNFRTTQLIWQIIKKRALTFNTIDYYSNLYTDENPDWITTKNSLKEIIQICRQNNIECYVIMFPILFQLNDEYPFLQEHSMIQQIVQDESGENIHFIDLFPAFKGKKDADLWVHPTDHHPNEVAHEIIAQYLDQYITVHK